MIAAIAVDDWKLPVFRKGLEDAGYEYTDAGEMTPGTTVLHVQYDSIGPLADVVRACADECARTGRP